MVENRRGSHTVTRLTVHIVWVTKYRYQVLKGEIQKRCRELIIQICDAEDVKILKGAVSKDHVHMHIEYPPSKSISDLVIPNLENSTTDNWAKALMSIISLNDLSPNLEELV
jgi:putative transposase